MTKKLSDDDVARIVGNRALDHLRRMYPGVFAAAYPSCRTSLRNHIRNDVNAIIRAFRGDDGSQSFIRSTHFDCNDESAGVAETKELPSP